MTARETALRAHKALLNGSGSLSYFTGRGLDAETVRGAFVGYVAEAYFPENKGALYKGPAFTYPCIGRTGGLLGIHYKSEARGGKGKRRQKWDGYADDLPRKDHGKKPDAPAKIIPFGMETLEVLEPGSLVILCCGEEDALSLRQQGYTALSQPGAGLLEPVYARELAGFEVVIFYDAGEEKEAHRDALKVKEAGAESVCVVEWPQDAENGADINGRLVEDPEGFKRSVAKMIAAAAPLEAPLPVEEKRHRGETTPKRSGEPDRYAIAGSGASSRRSSSNGKLPASMTAAELLGLKLPPMRWTIPDVLPEGVTLLAGRAKIGKSFLALGLCIAVACGGEALGKIPVGRGGALYIALDDTQRRLKKRLSEMLAKQEAPDNLHISLSWPRLNEGGAEALEGWLSEHPDTRLVVIDILQAIRPKTSPNRSLYEVDYDSLASLKPLVEKHAGVSIVVIHHLNQSQGPDPLQLISGSEGLVGVVDGALVLKRERGKPHATLYVAGKDIEDEREYALEWDAQLLSWALKGDASEFEMSDQRRKIRNGLRELDRPATAAEVAAHLDEPYENVRKLMPKMTDERIIFLHHVEGTTKYYVTDPNDPNDPKPHKNGSSVGSVGMGGFSNDPNAPHHETAANGRVSGGVGIVGSAGSFGTPLQEKA